MDEKNKRSNAHISILLNGRKCRGDGGRGFKAVRGSEMEHVAYREINSAEICTAGTCSSRERIRNRGDGAVEISKPVTDEGKQSV